MWYRGAESWLAERTSCIWVEGARAKEKERERERERVDTASQHVLLCHMTLSRSLSHSVCFHARSLARSADALVFLLLRLFLSICAPLSFFAPSPFIVFSFRDCSLLCSLLLSSRTSLFYHSHPLYFSLSVSLTLFSSSFFSSLASQPLSPHGCASIPLYFFYPLFSSVFSVSLFTLFLSLFLMVCL